MERRFKGRRQEEKENKYKKGKRRTKTEQGKDETRGRKGGSVGGSGKWRREQRDVNKGGVPFNMM